MNFIEGFKKHFLNTSWLIAERIFQMAVGLFVRIYIAHYLRPKQFDLLSYAISFVGFFLALSTFGLDSIVVIHELLGAPERRDEFIGTAFMLNISSALFMWIGIALALSFTAIDRQTILLLSIVPFLAIFQALNVVDFNYQTEVNSKLVVHAQLLQVFLSGLIKVALIAFGASLIRFSWTYLFNSFVLASRLLIIYLRYLGEISSWHIKFHTAKIY